MIGRLISALNRRIRTTVALRTAAVLTIIGLALMVWSMVQPTPLPVMLAMTVGQGVGTLAFVLYGFVVIRQLRRELRERRASRASRDSGDLGASAELALSLSSAKSGEPGELGASGESGR